MRQRFNDQSGEFVGWKFSRTEAAYISSNILPFLKGSNEWESRFLRTMVGDFNHDLPFLSIKQKERLDLILRRHGISNLSYLCDQLPIARWNGNTDSLINFIKEIMPLMECEFIWFYEYSPAAFAYDRTPLEIATEDHDLYFGFVSELDAEMVVAEITHRVQATV